MKNRTFKKLNGQTLVETTLLMPFFLFVIFSLLYLAFFLMENQLATYAAFMASRSYQVYGNERTSNGTYIFETVAQEIMHQGMPFIRRKNMSVHVDTHVMPREPDKFQENEWKNYLAFYYQASDVPFNPTPSDHGLYAKNIWKPRFGLIKLSFDQAIKIPFSDVSLSQKIIVPYQIEQRVEAHL